MDGLWIGPTGYIPGIGNVYSGCPVTVHDPELAAKVIAEGMMEPMEKHEQPRVVKPRKSIGGE